MTCPPCLCAWHDDLTAMAIGVRVAGVMAERNPACPTHGDGTPWWAHVQRRAAELAAERGLG